MALRTPLRVRVEPSFDPFLFYGAAGALLVRLGSMYVPPTQVLIRLHPLTLETWTRLTLVALSIVVLVEGHKLTRARWRVRSRRG